MDGQTNESSSFKHLYSASERCSQRRLIAFNWTLLHSYHVRTTIQNRSVLQSMWTENKHAGCARRSPV